LLSLPRSALLRKPDGGLTAFGDPTRGKHDFEFDLDTVTSWRIYCEFRGFFGAEEET